MPARVWPPAAPWRLRGISAHLPHRPPSWLAIVLTDTVHVAASFLHASLSIRAPCGPPVTPPGIFGSLGPSLLAFIPNLSLGLHLAPSTAASHPAPALHNQGKHQHATVVNHSSHRDDHHWSSIFPLMSALTTLRTNLIVWKLNQKMKRTSPEKSRSQVKSQKRSGRSKISVPQDKGNGSTRLRQEITWSLKKRQKGLNTNHVTR